MRTEADSSARCFAESEIDIESGAEKVFGILSDINRWPDWQSNVSRAEMTGAAAPGTRFRWKGGGLDIRSEFHTVTPFSELGWTGRIWWITAVHNWYLTGDNGKTHVKVMESLKGPGSSLMAASLKKGMDRSLAELKEFSEK